MLPLAIAVLAGAAVGAARRPLGAHLRWNGFRRWWLVGVAVAGQLGVVLGLGPLALAVTLAATAAFCLANLQVAGTGVTAAGAGLNLAAVVLHGGIPVRGSALVSAGIVEPGALDTVVLDRGRHLAEGGFTELIGDVVPIEALGLVVSFGDLVVWFGVAAIVGDLVRLARAGRGPWGRSLWGPTVERLRDEWRRPEVVEVGRTSASVFDGHDVDDDRLTPV